jgi:hypothetical protein
MDRGTGNHKVWHERLHDEVWALKNLVHRIRDVFDGIDLRGVDPRIVGLCSYRSANL